MMIKHLPMLPAERALKVISGRWKAVILYQLFDGPKRLSELSRLMPHVSQKVLIQQLREMESHGLLTREIYAQVPPRVDYSATELGKSLRPIIKSLCDWGRKHAEALDQDHRLINCPVDTYQYNEENMEKENQKKKKLPAARNKQKPPQVEQHL